MELNKVVLPFKVEQIDISRLKPTGEVNKASLMVDVKAKLGECPIWDE